MVGSEGLGEEGGGEGGVYKVFGKIREGKVGILCIQEKGGGVEKSGFIMRFWVAVRDLWLVDITCLSCIYMVWSWSGGI